MKTFFRCIVLSPQIQTFGWHWGICVMPLAICDASDNVLFPDETSWKQFQFRADFLKWFLVQMTWWEADVQPTDLEVEATDLEVEANRPQCVKDVMSQQTGDVPCWKKGRMREPFMWKAWRMHGSCWLFGGTNMWCLPFFPEKDGKIKGDSQQKQRSGMMMEKRGKVVKNATMLCKLATLQC